MNLRRFYLPNFSESIDNAELAHRFGRVLRIRIGQEVIFFDGQGGEYRSKILEINKKTIQIKLLEQYKSISPLDPQVFIYQSLTKPIAKLESVIQKCTELGATGFVPMITERTEGKLAKPERLQKIIIEACEQCFRGDIPQLSESQNLSEIIQNLPEGENIFLHTEAKQNFSDILPKLKTATRINIFIGPEGGFSSEELKNLQTFSLGDRILRTETVAPAILSALQFS